MDNPFINAAYNTVYKDFAFAVKPAVYNAQPSKSISDDGEVVIVEQTFKFKAVFIDWQKEQKAPSDLQTGDVMCLLPVKGIRFKPKTTETITLNTDRYLVVGVMDDPTGQALWMIQLRKIA